MRAAGAFQKPALRPRAAPRVPARTVAIEMGPKKRTSADTDAAGAAPPAAVDGDGASPKKKRGEKGAEKTKPAAKAPAEKTVIPKAELKKRDLPPAGTRLFKVAAPTAPRVPRDA